MAPILLACARTAAVRALILAILCVTASLCSTQAYASTAAPGLVVIPRPTPQLGLSYFDVTAQPGASVQAGSLELRNPTSHRLTVALSAVDARTLDTLGSGYAPPGSAKHGVSLWLALAAHRVTVAPLGGVRVPVSLLTPANAAPGDYLSGVSVETLDQKRQGLAQKGVSIASAERYAIGVEVLIPGPRHPLIQFTGASLQRQPAGLMFLLHARNAGNVILQKVHGHVLVTRGGHTIASRAIEAGTFVSATSIVYPVAAEHQDASAGTRYRVQASLRYGHKTARLDTTVTFGRREAVIQSHYAQAVPTRHEPIAWWKIAIVAAILLYAMLATILLLRRSPQQAVQR